MKLRPLGQVLLDAEPLIEELLIGHELQIGDLHALLDVYVQVHYPDAREVYEDGTSPALRYGPQAQGLKSVSVPIRGARGRRAAR